MEEMDKVGYTSNANYADEEMDTITRTSATRTEKGSDVFVIFWKFVRFWGKPRRNIVDV